VRCLGLAFSLLFSYFSFCLNDFYFYIIHNYDYKCFIINVYLIQINEGFGICSHQKRQNIVKYDITRTESRKSILILAKGIDKVEKIAEKNQSSRATTTFEEINLRN